MKSMWIVRGISVTLALSLTACGQGFKGASFSSVGSASVESLDTKAIEAATVEAQTSILDASALLESVDQASQTPVNSKTLSPTSFILDGFKGKLSKKLDLVLAKVAAVKARYNEARARIADALAKIDTTNPQNAAIVTALTAQMAKLDQLEQKFYEGIQLLADKLDLASASLDKLALLAGTSAGAINPIFGGIAGFAAQYVISQVQDVIAQFKTKLLAL